MRMEDRMPIIIEKKKGGRIRFKFEPNAEFLKDMPLAIVRKRKLVLVEFSPNTEFPIADVARFTGYNSQTLQRLDGKTIPPSHRDDNGRRVWFAKDIVTIRAYRNKTTQNRVKR